MKLATFTAAAVLVGSLLAAAPAPAQDDPQSPRDSDRRHHGGMHHQGGLQRPVVVQQRPLLGHRPHVVARPIVIPIPIPLPCPVFVPRYVQPIYQYHVPRPVFVPRPVVQQVIVQQPLYNSGAEAWLHREWVRQLDDVTYSLRDGALDHAARQVRSLVFNVQREATPTMFNMSVATRLRNLLVLLEQPLPNLRAIEDQVGDVQRMLWAALGRPNQF